MMWLLITLLLYYYYILLPKTLGFWEVPPVPPRWVFRGSNTHGENYVSAGHTSRSVSFCNFLHRNAFCTTTTEERLNSAAILYVHHEIHVCDAVDLKSIRERIHQPRSYPSEHIRVLQQVIMLSATEYM